MVLHAYMYVRARINFLCTTTNYVLCNNMVTGFDYDGVTLLDVGRFCLGKPVPTAKRHYMQHNILANLIFATIH